MDDATALPHDEPLDIWLVKRDGPRAYTVWHQQSAGGLMHVDREPVGTRETIEEARQLIPPDANAQRLARTPGVDIGIAEVWL